MDRFAALHWTQFWRFCTSRNVTLQLQSWRLGSQTFTRCVRRCFDTCSRVEDWCGVCSVWAWLVGGAAELGHSSNIRDLMMITDQDGLLWIRGSCHQHRATRLNLKRISASLQPWYQPRHCCALPLVTRGQVPRSAAGGHLLLATAGAPATIKISFYWGEESSWWRSQPLFSWLNLWFPTM